jgi:hypothetical protein
VGKRLIYITLIFLAPFCYADKITTMQIGADSETVGLWHINAGAGSIAYDTSGNGSNGTITGAVWADGLWGDCLDFNVGTSDKLVIGDKANLSFTLGGGTDTAFTIAFWANPESLAQTRIAISKHNNVAGEYTIALDNSNQIDVNLYNASGAFDTRIRAISGTNLTTGEWQFIVITYDGSKHQNGINIYRNAVLDVDTRENGAVPYVGMGDTAAEFWISGRNFPGTTLHFDGKLEEVFVLQREMTLAEISYLYSRQ